MCRGQGTVGVGGGVVCSPRCLRGPGRQERGTVPGDRGPLPLQLVVFRGPFEGRQLRGRELLPLPFDQRRSWPRGGQVLHGEELGGAGAGERGVTLLVVQRGGGGLGSAVAELLVPGAGGNEEVSTLAGGTEGVRGVGVCVLLQLVAVLGLCENIVLYGRGTELALESEVSPARAGGPVAVRTESVRGEHRVVEEGEVRGQQGPAGGGAQLLGAQFPRQSLGALEQGPDLRGGQGLEEEMLHQHPQPADPLVVVLSGQGQESGELDPVPLQHGSGGLQHREEDFDPRVLLQTRVGGYDVSQEVFLEVASQVPTVPAVLPLETGLQPGDNLLSALVQEVHSLRRSGFKVQVKELV